jgi:hypothetical protein
MKTVSGEEEVREAETAFKQLGAVLEGNFDYEIQGVPHRILKIQKVSQTPEKYPRRFAKIQKQPL